MICYASSGHSFQDFMCRLAERNKQRLAGAAPLPEAQQQLVDAFVSEYALNGLNWADDEAAGRTQQLFQELWAEASRKVGAAAAPQAAADQPGVWCAQQAYSTDSQESAEAAAGPGQQGSPPAVEQSQQSPAASGRGAAVAAEAEAEATPPGEPVAAELGVPPDPPAAAAAPSEGPAAGPAQAAAAGPADASAGTPAAAVEGELAAAPAGPTLPTPPQLPLLGLAGLPGTPLLIHASPADQGNAMR